MIDDDNNSDTLAFSVPESFLEKLYEFTGNGDDGGGFILAYVNNEGKAMINCKIGSQIIEMGLRKALERFLEDIEMGEKAAMDEGPDAPSDLA
jgi:hypothetical protein|tara:strand:+ start:57 stop:335 length:279 start_codon:yes stop_codon:yes gene_type:complete